MTFTHYFFAEMTSDRLTSADFSSPDQVYTLDSGPATVSLPIDVLSGTQSVNVVSVVYEQVGELIGPPNVS